MNFLETTDMYELLYLERNEKMSIRVPEIFKTEMHREFEKENQKPKRKDRPLSFSEFVMLKMCKKI